MHNDSSVFACEVSRIFIDILNEKHTIKEQITMIFILKPIDSAFRNVLKKIIIFKKKQIPQQ